MDIPIRFHKRYKHTHNDEVSTLYGLKALCHSQSFTFTISIPKEHARNINKVETILTSAGLDSGVIQQIKNNISTFALEQDDEVYYSKLLNTVTRSVSTRTSLEIANGTSNPNLIVVNNIPIATTLEVLYESVYPTGYGSTTNVAENQPASPVSKLSTDSRQYSNKKWYASCFTCHGTLKAHHV
jgi:hypothetical protein